MIAAVRHSEAAGFISARVDCDQGASCTQPIILILPMHCSNIGSVGPPTRCDQAVMELAALRSSTSGIPESPVEEPAEKDVRNRGQE